MKSKRFVQIIVLVAMLFTPVGGLQSVQAQTNSEGNPDAFVLDRDLSYWNAVYYGFVSSSLYEKWEVALDAPHTFVVTATTVFGDLTPLLILLDANGSELARGTGALTSTQAAGTYFVEVQPETGSGIYMFTVRDVAQTMASSSTVLSPTSIHVGETAVVTANLVGVPPEGYTSAEFTCTYDPAIGEVSNILPTTLFGADPAVALNGPSNGNFIVAIAGSNGSKATTSGAALTFNVKGLQAGQAAIECIARISQGDNALTQIPSAGAATLTVLGDAATATFTPTPAVSLTPTPLESATPTLPSTPGASPTPTLSTPVASETPTETATLVASPTATLPPTATATATATAVPLTGTLTGQVLAGKPVTIGLYDTNNALIGSLTANSDGTFSLAAAAGTYAVRANASGYLSAQAAVTLNGGATTTLPPVTLPAGDLDNNNIIDQFDAMTIGMNYNTATPAAADLNNDGVINVLDLELLARNYRMIGPVIWQ